MPAPETKSRLPRPRGEGTPNEAPARRDAAPGRREAGGGERPPRSLGRFLRETRGAAGYMAAAVAIMLVGGTALVGDHQWMVGRRDVLQSAADAASVAATFALRHRSNADSDAEVEAALLPVARRYARFNVVGNTIGEIEPEDVEVALDISRATGTVTVSVTADLARPLFAEALYSYEGPGAITARAGAERDTVATEVVLALDVTVSMAKDLAGNTPGAGELSRMEVVRRAAHTLVDILDPGDGGGAVAIGVVPWHFNVRLNETMRADWESKGWAVYPRSRVYPLPYQIRPGPAPRSEGYLMPPKPEQWNGCLDQRSLTGGTPPGLGAALPSNTSFTMAFYPVFKDASYQCLDIPGLGVSRWYNYVRQWCYHGPTFPCSSSKTCLQYRVSAQYGCSDASAQPILPLTRDMEGVRDAIDALTPHGVRTYSTMGLVWGRRLLEPTWRDVWGGDVHPVDPDDEPLGTRKAIVLLTDGEDNHGSNVGAASNRDRACAAAKDAGIEVFVIAAMDPRRIGGRLERGLTRCSSQGDHPDRTYVFLNNTSNDELEEAFRQVAHQLLVVRRIL